MNQDNHLQIVIDALYTPTESLGQLEQELQSANRAADELAQHDFAANVTAALPEWRLLNGLAGTLATQLGEKTSPAMTLFAQAQTAARVASENLHKHTAIAYTDLIGIKGAADSAALAVLGLNAAMRGLPDHLPPYGGSAPATTTTTAGERRAAGGPFEAGGAYFINEDPRSRPEVVVQNPSGGGYVLTRQDAQAALAGRGGHTFNFYPGNELDVEFVARRVVELMQGG